MRGIHKMLEQCSSEQYCIFQLTSCSLSKGLQQLPLLLKTLLIQQKQRNGLTVPTALLIKQISKPLSVSIKVKTTTEKKNTRERLSFNSPFLNT